MAKSWSRYIFHPLFISLIISILSIFLIVRNISYYKTNIVESFTVNNNGQIYYDDIDNDGNSEKLQYYHYDQIFEPTLYLYNSNNKIQSLWNFFELPIKNYKIATEDFNLDNQKEIFIFSQRNDSIFFYAFNPLNDKTPYVKRKFVTTFSGESEKLSVKIVGVYNLDNQGDLELLFYINNKYPATPRKIFAYNFNDEKLISSPNLDVNIKDQILVQDIDGDSFLDIIVSNNSVEIQGNGNQSEFIVLNHKLEFKFNPIKYHGLPSQISNAIIKDNDSLYIACLHSGSEAEVFNNLLIFNSQGNKVKEKKLLNESNSTIISYPSSQNTIIHSGNKLIFLDGSLEPVKRIQLLGNQVEYVDYLEMDLNSCEELIFHDSSDLILFSDDFNKQIKINHIGNSDFIFSVDNSIDGKSYLSAQSKNKWNLIEISRNNSLIQSGLFQALLFVIIFLIFYSILRLFRVNRNDKNKLNNLDIDIADTELETKETELVTKIIDQKLIKDLQKKDSSDIKDTQADFKTKLLDLLKDYPTIKYQFYPEDEKFLVPYEMGLTVENFFKESLEYLKELSKDGSVFVQVFKHKGHLNICTEINNKRFDKDHIKEKINFDSLVNNYSWKFDVADISEDSKIVNTTIPLKQSNKSDKIKVIIAEDHDVSLFGLLSLFKAHDDIEIIGTAKNGMEVLSLLESNKVHVVITDISMPGMDGIELSERLKKDYPEIKVIVFTMYMENWFVEQLIKNNVKGFVSKSSKVNELIGAVRNVNDGFNYYCPQFKVKFGIKGKQNGDSKAKLESLLSSEMQIIKYYAENLSKQAIAEKLNVSVDTMDSIIANILLKINAADENEIIQIAKRQKFISE